MSLMGRIADEIIDVCLSGRSCISTCSSFGISCEGWLKVELLNRFILLTDQWNLTDILPEYQNIDLVLRTHSEEVLIELKTFPTNYRRGGGKPITNFIDSVISDLNKLSTRSSGNTNITGIAVWMAYLIPEPTPSEWHDHLNRIEEAVGSTLRAERIPLWESNYANLYIMKCR